MASDGIWWPLMASCRFDLIASDDPSDCLPPQVRTRGLGMYGAQLQSNVTVQSESLEDFQLRMMLIRRYDQANVFLSTSRAAQITSECMLIAC
jgi:hypothetical protein